MVGVQGSALNKWPRGQFVLRDMDTANSSSPPADKSAGKGIYNLTLTSDETLDQDKSIYQPDMGEEVYGCISSGYTNTTPTIEYDADVAINNRKARKDYPPDVKHFSADGRNWTGGVESACIPRENLPLVVNSKFPINYWQNKGVDKKGNAQAAKMVTIKAGAGFTSGALVRPVAFSNKAEEIPNGAVALTVAGGGSAYTLSGVPIETAHAILNRCKEISISGSASLKQTRTSAKCDGPQSSTSVWEEEERKGCPPGTCMNRGGSENLNCVSTQAITQIKLAGSVDMTAYRYKQLADVWNDPKTLDLSGNYFYGSKENGAYLRKTATSYCDQPSSDKVKVPYPTIQRIGQYEKQTKLSSGCLVYPKTNASILLATEDKNLASIELSLACKKSGTTYSIGTATEAPRFSSSIHPGGASTATDISPLLISGPSLACRFNGSGWDYSGLGLDSAEDLYTEECKDGNNFFNYKMKWNSTGISKTIVSGGCEVGISGLKRYDRSMSKGCESEGCGKQCEACKSNYGTLDLECACTPLCSTPDKDNKVPCYTGEYPPACDGTYGFSFDIGKYVGVETDASKRLHVIAPISLSAKSDTKTENLTLFWNGFITEGAYSGPLGMPLILGEESAATALLTLKDNSTTKYEKRSVGTLTIKCKEWSTSAPLWTVLGIAKKTACVGVANSVNTYTTTVKGAPLKDCNGCDRGEFKRCCSDQGCDGFSGDETECCQSLNCGIDDPCGYAVVSNQVGKECLGNTTFPTCASKCESSNGEDCGCCGCRDEEDTYCDVICPPMITCAPYKLVEEHVKLGCFGDAHEEDVYEASADLTLEFKLFTEME